MTPYSKIQETLRNAPKTWLVTGVAGFIASNILETLLKLGQKVVGLDNLSTGHHSNFAAVKQLVGDEAFRSFRFIEGDIRDPAVCAAACQGVDYVLHHAALGSVPLSLEKPLLTNEANVTGFLNIMVGAKAQNVRRVVFASSSAVYGTDARLPKIEEQIGASLSPYATSKYMNELYAAVCQQCYQQEYVALRYFNVFGPRQDPKGAYAAVIPQWTAAMIRQDPVYINGDGETTRDFCFVSDVVQANILSATTPNPEALNRAYNVGSGGTTTLNQLFFGIQKALVNDRPQVSGAKPVYREFRIGDIRHSQADITKARTLLGFQPEHTLDSGLARSMPWYLKTTV